MAAATQADVAELAGVSRKTVSNVVNQYPHVSKDLVQRVNAAIATLGYRPNQAARTLRTGRTRTIQLVVPELDVPYFAELARGVVRAAESRNFSVLIRQTFGDRERETRAIDGDLGDHADGTILSPVSSNLDSIRDRQSPSPVVLVGELQGGDSLPHIGIDNEAAAHDATAHLISRGRRRVGFIGAQDRDDSRMAQMRRAGWARALETAGLDPDESLVRYTDGYHRADGAAAMRDLIESAAGVDAVFCATDLLALGAIRAAFDAGVRVPQDVAIAGFDGVDEGRYSVPSLTTIAPNKQLIAERAVERLVELMAELDDPYETPRDAAPEVLIPFELIVRESSGN